MKKTAIIEARMTSTRLPGKILLPILGKPMLELLIERLQQARQVDQIVVATTTNSTDDCVEELTRRLNVGCFRGSEDDVLERVLQAAHVFDTDLIIEITGDCPLMDSGVVDHIIETYLKNSYDYVGNCLDRTYPRGLDVQVFSTRVLERVAQLTDDPVDHEHVSIYIYEHPQTFSIYNVSSGLPEKFREIRLTVDTREDFELIRTIYESLYPKNPHFTLMDILAFLDERRDLLELNKNIQQKKVR